jgi:hypothetical protein
MAISVRVEYGKAEKPSPLGKIPKRARRGAGFYLQIMRIASHLSLLFKASLFWR